ncbi:MAG: diguanylate cyclase domain-containing protein [Mycobacterium sp.]|uniref:diguanylate cyclase domain-containing protein n=1 Tax=Mycobacterium sp. TaxID=1785 RepID=UPI00389A0894
MQLRIPGGVRALSALSNRALLLVGAAYLAATVLVGLWLWQSWGGAYVSRMVDEAASLASVLFAAGSAGRAARAAQGRARQGWLAMMAGLLAWAAGEVIWGYYEVWLGYEQAPFPSWADAGYLLFPLGAGAAVLLLSDSDRGQSRKRLLLDGVIIAASMFLISWLTVLDRVFQAGSENSLAFAVSLAYPVTDVAIITIAWTVAVAVYRPRMALLVGGLILVAVSDSIFAALTAVGSYHTGNLIDLGWILGWGVLGMAALRSIVEPTVGSTTGPNSSRVRLWLPYLPLVIACGLGLAVALPELGSFALAAAGLLIVVAVLARQFLVLAENRRLLSDVLRLAFRDQLTGLPNRASFLDRLEQAVARQRREHKPLAVLCLDLDNFKTVNDELGHPAGDELLVRVAGRLSGCLRTTDTVARLGGDEFAILIEGSLQDALVAADRILDTFNTPIVVDGVALTVRPSVGLTLATGETPQITVHDLLRHADLAMYAAKRDGGGCLRIFVPDLPNPYEVPEISEPVNVPNAATAVAPMSAADSEQTAQLRETVQVSTQWPPLGIRMGLGVLMLGVGVFAISTVVRAHPGRIVPLDSWLESASLLSAAGLVAIRACRVAVERWAWLLIAAGMTATGVATIVYAVWVPEGLSPSVADPVFLAFYPLVYTGLLLLLGGRLLRVPTAIRLDAVVVAFAASAVGAALVSGPMDGATRGSLATVLVGLAYPTGGVLLLALAGGSLAILGWRTEWRWGLLIAGFALGVLADIIYLFQAARGSYLEGSWIDACWPAAFLLIAVSSWLPSTIGPSRPKPGPVSLAPPIVCSVIALGVAILAYGEQLPVTLAALTLAAVAARYAMTFRDVSALAESHEQAMTDELTGLANRRALATALTAGPLDEPMSTTSDRAAARLGLLLLDVDQFGEINDSLGRHVGDDLLRRIADRLSQAVRPGDLLTRTGGDEFAILLADGVNLTTARAHAGTLMDALRAPFALGHITVQVDVTIAIALWPDHCAHPRELLNLGEAAMNGAKTTDHRIAVYDAVADLYSSNGAQLIEDLRTTLSTARRALSELGVSTGELTCHYQPKISAEDERVHSVEALVRWHHPTHGLLLPDQFLPAAERASLMGPLAARVLEIALAQIRSWRDQGITLTVAVNLSTTNLLDLGLVDTIDRLLHIHRLPADALILEITESTLTTDSQRSRNTVGALRQLGIRLSLDDYGTGWSSLARLQDLSVDELKLDKVFVARLARDPRSIAIVRSTVALAHSLGADLVAEGVEDEATLHALRRYGCTITQGHVHSPPLPADELYAWLVSRTPQLMATPSREAGILD